MTVYDYEGTYPVMYGTQTILIGSGHLSAYMTRPDRRGKFPNIIVLSDRSGIDSAEKSIGFKLARHGYATLSLDLSSPQLSTDKAGLSLVEETVEYLQSTDQDWLHPERMGILGFGSGGRIGLLSAATSEWLGAIGLISCPLADPEDSSNEILEVVAGVTVPLLSIYGEEDTEISPELIDRAQQRLPASLWLRYQGVGPHFYDLQSDQYHRSSDRDALYRLQQLFTQYLPTPSPEEPR